MVYSMPKEQARPAANVSQRLKENRARAVNAFLHNPKASAGLKLARKQKKVKIGLTTIRVYRADM